ncbi:MULTISPECIES: hypothetical protein [unclassified Modestobacter]|uniref:hypothetical protein n=1 Tax=unclassified Modestobacter TaxID=2643866 RepID=UPI0022AB202A|nr:MULTISPECIES: hypothetical protein [unclassified Modestobacter]MCZ2824236.1 hypothetical protein [Modestobacter sp. VKM Ac-2981]MCZ2854236.1 hypothetical protein [Modestobacter sp. VKM Ac-2982]
MSTSGENRSSPRARRWLLLALVGLLVLLALAVAAVVVAQRDDPVDLSEGISAEEVGQDVDGSGLVVSDTIQSVGFFVDTDTGPVFVYYGDTTDRFGIGTTIAELEGEVAAVTDGFLDDLGGELEPEQLALLADVEVYVQADELAVVPRAGS